MELQHLTIPRVVAARNELFGPVIVAERNARAVLSRRTPASGSRRWEEVSDEDLRPNSMAAPTDVSDEFESPDDAADSEVRSSIETLIMTRAQTPPSGSPPPLPSALSTMPGVAALSERPDAPPVAPLGLQALVPTIGPSSQGGPVHPPAIHSEPPSQGATASTSSRWRRDHDGMRRRHRSPPRARSRHAGGRDAR